MDWKTIVETVWAALNSPAGITAMAGVLLWALNRLYTAKPLWQQYEGTVIAAIRLAEKQVPDETTNAGLARLDAALKYVITVYEQAVGRRATSAEVAEFTNGIQVVHNSMDEAGTI